MIPIFHASKNSQEIEQIRARLSVRPLLMEGLDAEDGKSKFAIVREILQAVRQRGDLALLQFTERFDGTVIPADHIRLSQTELEADLDAFPPAFGKALDAAIANVRQYQQAMLAPTPPPISLSNCPGSSLGLKFTPIDRVGIYVPGGAAAYPSTVIMTAVPAQVAGVKEICICSPRRDGAVSGAVLLAAHKLGITEIYGIGGAQAIAALAFGTNTVRPVDKIVGPGNSYVQLAKKELYGIVDIDSFAGPSEVIVLADDSANPRHVAAELLAQAEHTPGSCLLITTSASLAHAVQAEMERQLKTLPREINTRKALEFASGIIIVENLDQAIALTDQFAPEHLQITAQNVPALAARIRHAGAIFIGPHTPVAAGDYLVGPSHVLPTSGTARFFSGLSADSFRKRTSLVQLDAQSLKKIAADIREFAVVEGLDGHARSVNQRLTTEPEII